jgi:hypothetical protein
MTIHPHGLHAVTADHLQLAQLESGGRQLLFRPAMKLTHYIHLAFAPGARACTPQIFEPDEGFRPIIPLHRQLLAYDLNIFKRHFAK